MGGLTISSTCFIDPAGKAVRELPEFARDAKGLTSLYRAFLSRRVYIVPHAKT